MSNFMKSSWKSLAFILALIVVVGIFTFASGGQQGASFELDGDLFVLHGPEEFSTTVNLNQLRSIETRDNFSPGTCLDGQESYGYSYGTWENEEFGQYQLCKLTKVPTCVVMTDEAGNVTVFNFENTQTTEEFGRSFSEYLRQNGYL